ncbi:hypothetical protein AB0D14_39555 [Streptomyces sp. NPDC048484]|uniref:hypothetical protein n=1 Tax=Streptomyces sp. NPDC048484 TaxID=3155146 RepID=UPI00341DF81E
MRARAWSYGAAGSWVPLPVIQVPVAVSAQAKETAMTVLASWSAAGPWRLREVWSRLLGEAVTDSDDIDAVISTLRDVEIRLVARTRPGSR